MLMGDVHSARCLAQMIIMLINRHQDHTITNHYECHILSVTGMSFWPPWYRLPGLLSFNK